MDFFESQDRARKSTRRLILFFGLAVAAIILAIYFIVLAVFDWGEGLVLEGPGDLWVPELFALVAAGTLLLIGGGSLFKILALRRGGPAVAEMLGGRPVSPNTADFGEKRFLNVVEEMAIASGTPVPAVYVLDREPGLNAFAAGYGLSDAAVAVTRGCLENLTRDELQGVIAHEFSHILNGDMRLNIRLIGILFGILLISIVGRGLVHSRGVSRRSDRGGGLIFLGLALLLVGAIGVFFGRMIQAAVSRQREFLADAAAVQFTRNPSGIAGALKKIGGLSSGSRIENHHAGELSHLFFAEGVGSALSRLFATHPPLRERIGRIDPQWDGKFVPVTAAAVAATGAPARAAFAAAAAPAGASSLAGSRPQGSERIAVQPGQMVATVGAPSVEHFRYAATLMAALPESLKEAAHEPRDAEAVVYALLLDPQQQVRRRQLQVLDKDVDPLLLERVRSLQPQVDAAGPDLRLPLLDLALPALRQLSPEQFGSFSRSLRKLILADNKVTFFEFALEKVLERHLTGFFDPQPRTGALHRSLEPIREDLGLILSALAYAGADGPEQARQAFAAGIRWLSLPGAEVQLVPEKECSFERLDESLKRMDRATAAIKRRFLEAAVSCVAWDGTVRREEAELLRAVADAIDCPMPPVLQSPPQRKAPDGP